ncbi:hypothetical protein SCWH03_46320 [Streptomyces pacificus]|uniref:Uncharacterized protein n=1 Tax=Streptomyces pacificus TaxID=2705029 RepID=A0A6A0AZJ3_9ACTN|nr:hypothetical protein SCWH03_46320 [Streptomyces pacificus]
MKTGADRAAEPVPTPTTQARCQRAGGRGHLPPGGPLRRARAGSATATRAPRVRACRHESMPTGRAPHREQAEPTIRGASCEVRHPRRERELDHNSTGLL